MLSNRRETPLLTIGAREGEYHFPALPWRYYNVAGLKATRIRFSLHIEKTTRGREHVGNMKFASRVADVNDIDYLS
jgi:hypothetical protein